MGALDKSRYIGYYEAAFFPGLSDYYNTEIRLQCGKRIIRNFRTRRRNTRDQRRLPDIGVSHQPYIRQKLEFQTKYPFFPRTSLFMLTGRLMSGRGELRIAPATTPSAGNDNP